MLGKNSIFISFDLSEDLKNIINITINVNHILSLPLYMYNFIYGFDCVQWKSLFYLQNFKLFKSVFNFQLTTAASWLPDCIT